MSIRDWPQEEQPRMRFLRDGPKALSDSELLAIFLRTGTKGVSALDLARSLISRFGSLKHLLQADEQQFCEAKGLGKAKYVMLQAVLEMAKRHLAEKVHEKPVLSQPEQAKTFLRSQLGAKQEEVFACLFLDAQCHLIQYEELFHGSVTQTAIYPRMIIKQAIRHNASSIVFAHNHPSGVCYPSDADIALTKKLKDILDTLEVTTVDHIIVGDSDVYSFAEHGLLQ